MPSNTKMKNAAIAARTVVYTTNAIESINSRLRKIIKTRGHFPSDEAATKPIWLALCTYCVRQSVRGRACRVRWQQPQFGRALRRDAGQTSDQLAAYATPSGGRVRPS